MNKDLPALRISVIIPSYNCGPFVANAVDSVLAQTMQDFEVIVVDDGSTDNTREVLRPYLSYPKFRYIRQQNHGVSAARNTGARASESEYLAFLDADDMFVPEAFDSITAALDSSGASWCLFDIVRVIGELQQIRQTVVPDGDLLHGILRADFICRDFFFRRRDFVEIGGFDESLRCREDWEIRIRFIENGRPFVHLHRPLYLYTWREGSITKASQVKNLYYTEQVLRKHHKRLADAGDQEVAKIYAANMWGLGRDYFYRARDYKRALGCIRESLAYDQNIGRMFYPFVHHFRRLLGSA